MIRLATSETKELMRKISITDEAWRLANRVFSNDEWEVFPGISNFDFRLRTYLKEMSQKLKNLPWGQIDEDGVFQGNPLDRDPLDLKAIPGMRRFPLDFGTVDDIEVLKTRDRVDRNFLKILKTLMSLTHEKRLPSYGKFAKSSNMGFPLGKNDFLTKQAVTKRILNNIPDIISAWRRRDLETLFKEWSILFLTHTQLRLQVDKYEKEREILLFGSQEGDQSIKPSKYIGEFSMMRTRTVCAYANALNYLFSALCDGMRNYREKVFYKTWKHRGQEDILTKIKAYLIKRKGSKVTTIDFGNYDRTIRYWMIQAYLDNLPLNDDLKEIAWYQFLSPRYCSHDGNERYLLEANPLEFSQLRWYRGLTSGIWCTSDLGKTIAIALQLWGLWETGYVKYHPETAMFREFCRCYLNHEWNIASLNMGDDNVFMGDRKIVDNVIKFLADKGFKVEIESGAKFLGNIFFYDEGDLKITLGPISYLIGAWLPERRWNDSTFRPYGIWGLLDRRRKEIYGSHPLFTRVREIEISTFREIFGSDMGDIERNNLVLPPSTFSESQIDYSDLLAKPELIYYKLDEEDIPNEILDMLYYKLDPVFVESKIKDFVKIDYIQELK